MLVFAILSILLVLGVVLGSPAISPIVDSLFPWSLVVLAIAGGAMFAANVRQRT